MTENEKRLRKNKQRRESRVRNREWENERKRLEYKKNAVEIRSKRKEYRAKNKKKIKEYGESLKSRILSWKKGARRRGIKWDINEDILLSLPMTCYYSKRKLTLKSNFLNTVSLDRINNKKGYVKGNVCFCMTVVNNAKSTMSKTQYINLANDIAKNNKQP